jgi:HEAT repeat protein
MKHAIRPGNYIKRGCCTLVLAVASSTSFVGPALARTAVLRSLKHQSQTSLTPLQFEIEKQRQRLSSLEGEERRDAVMRLGGLRRPEASKAALAALNDPVPIVRAAAAVAILSLPADEGAAALIPLLSDKDEFVRREASYALGKTKSRSAVTPLIERLTTDKENGVRGAAATALGQIGDETAVAVLAQVLSPGDFIQPSRKTRIRKAKENQFVLKAVARSLGQIGSRAGVPALIYALSTDSLSDDVRREAARSLGLIGDPSAVPALRAATDARDPYLSRIAYEALRKIAPKEARIPS